MNAVADVRCPTFYGCTIGNVDDDPSSATLVCLSPMIIGGDHKAETVQMSLRTFLSIAKERGYLPLGKTFLPEAFCPDWARMPRQVEHILLYAACYETEEEFIEGYFMRNDADATAAHFSFVNTEHAIELASDVGIIFMKS